MCASCEWEEALFLADEILDVWPDNDFAASVRDWIEKNEHVTEDQMGALENVHDRVVR